MKVSCNEFVHMYKGTSEEKRFLLDVRTPEEYAGGSISGSINIPVGELENRFAEIPTDKEIFIYCRSGGRAERAEMFLIHKGIKTIKHLNPGGYDELKKII